MPARSTRQEARERLIKTMMAALDHIIPECVTEAGVKQFNKRVKGTEQFWDEAGIEPILTLREPGRAMGSLLGQPAHLCQLMAV
jgi:hypothetical protein